GSTSDEPMCHKRGAGKGRSLSVLDVAHLHPIDDQHLRKPNKPYYQLDAKLPKRCLLTTCHHCRDLRLHAFWKALRLYKHRRMPYRNAYAILYESSKHGELPIQPRTIYGQAHAENPCGQDARYKHAARPFPIHT